jgi:hypothetical protein
VVRAQYFYMARTAFGVLDPTELQPHGVTVYDYITDLGGQSTVFLYGSHSLRRARPN